MTEAIDLSSIPENQRVAYYGILFAIAAADGTFDAGEMAQICRTLDLSGLSQESQDRVRGFRVHPPSIEGCLVTLADAGDELRFGVMVGLVDLALADDVLDPAEVSGLEAARDALGISASQLDAMRRFIDCAKVVDAGGEEDAATVENLKSAAEAMGADGIPVSAAYFSATVNSIIASEFQSAVAAIGLGLGMVPGLSIAVLVGVTVQVSVSDLLKPSGGSSPGTDRRETRTRRARAAVVSLQKSINDLAIEIEAKRGEPSGDEATTSGIEELEERCDGLRQLMLTRRSAIEDSE